MSVLLEQNANAHRQMEGAVAIMRGIDNGCDYAITTSCRNIARLESSSERSFRIILEMYYSQFTYVDN